MQTVINYINTFKDKIIHIHWHDNHGNRDKHLPIGAGLIDHQRAIKALKKIYYDRTITLEVFTNRSDAKASTNKFKSDHKKYQLLILDIKMLEMNGFELYEK
jgi:sugar phosphate isomerase/epimerase